MAGAGYKLFNTGDVLTAAQVNTYLMEQTVMVFADAAARTTALTGVVSEGMLSYLKSTKQVEVYNGSAWVASDDPNAIQNSIINAKGDLIAGSANDTPAILSVGNSGETIVADSAATTGLRWQVPKTVNAVFNSSFDVWQRGTSFTGVSPYYGPDRWFLARAGGGSGATWTRVSSGLTGFNYALRAQRDSGTTGTSEIRVAGQSLETVDSLRFAGKTITFSFYARVGANYSGGTSAYGIVKSGTATDQQYWNSGYTGDATPAFGFLTGLNTTWQRFSFTGTVASSATEIAFGVGFTPTGTAGANDWLEVTGFQLEEGSVVTNYQRMSGTIQGELAACQRYYFRINASTVYASFGVGANYSTSQAQIHVVHPVQMRIGPSSVDFANLTLINAAAGVQTFTTLALSNTSPLSSFLNIQGSSGLVGGNANILVANNSTSAFLAFNAEL